MLRQKCKTVVLFYILLLNNNLIYAEKRFRIFGGKEASIENHPWIVSLQVSSKGHDCGGSLIADDWVITAAHCFAHLRLSPDSIIAGTSNLTGPGTTIKIEHVIKHELFTMKKFYNYDIALVKLAEKVTFSKTIQPINLPEQDAQLRVGTSVGVAGWGRTKLNGPPSKVLMETNVTVTDHHFGKTIIFAYNKQSGTCEGDSGGPLELDGTLVGIMSGSMAACESQFPAIYTHVALFRTWIKEKIGI
ncbi:trypsin-1-like [Diabrotica virgifera virgifera]|uniref:Peptidase S1 domain-containing protein n=1 Tax=Diabrotica virgifera virgifera TaxID=50390 RepID=A0ABM5JIV3_DIAVI|nr:trypsin-1-like [Diabrotica virgifera virgifera]